MAYTGIAATLLINGRTIHNRFGFPGKFNKETTSSIRINSKAAEEIKNTMVFIIDEAPMVSKYMFEEIDRLLQEIMGNKIPFGGKMLFCGGDFRYE